MTIKITAIITAAFLVLMGQADAQTTQKEKGQLTKIVEMKQLNPKNYTT